MFCQILMLSKFLKILSASTFKIFYEKNSYIFSSKKSALKNFLYSLSQKSKRQRISQSLYKNIFVGVYFQSVIKVFYKAL